MKLGFTVLSVSNYLGALPLCNGKYNWFTIPSDTRTVLYAQGLCNWFDLYRIIKCKWAFSPAGRLLAALATQRLRSHSMSCDVRIWFETTSINIFNSFHEALGSFFPFYESDKSADRLWLFKRVILTCITKFAKINQVMYQLSLKALLHFPQRKSKF